MSDTLSYFGIYPDEIERADEICQDVLEHLGVSDNEIDRMYSEAYDDFYSADFDSFGHMTNALIYFMFNSVRSLIKEKYPDLDVDIYVNGYDSHLCVNGMSADDFDFDELENGEEDDN